VAKYSVLLEDFDMSEERGALRSGENSYCSRFAVTIGVFVAGRNSYREYLVKLIEVVRKLFPRFTFVPLINQKSPRDPCQRI
jgi:hypothetical protein